MKSAKDLHTNGEDCALYYITNITTLYTLIKTTSKCIVEK